jgi:hypothetical protein
MVLGENRMVSGLAKLCRGGRGLLLGRWLLFVALSVPGILHAKGAIAGSVALSPYYTEVEGRLPVIHLQRFLGELPSSILPLLVGMAFLGLILNQIMSAGALVYFRGTEKEEDNPGLWHLLFNEGLPYFWRFMRILCIALALFLLGVFALGKFFEYLALRGEVAGWSGATLMIDLPALKVSACTFWLWLVGGWAYATKVITVLDNRRRIRRTAFHSLRLCWRHPVRLMAFYALLTLLGTLTGAALLFAWRQGVPRTTAPFVFFGVTALTLSFLRSAFWYWLHGAGARLYRDGKKSSDLRDRSDAPFGWWSKWIAFLPFGKRSSEL